MANSLVLVAAVIELMSDCRSSHKHSTVHSKNYHEISKNNVNDEVIA